MDVMPYSFQPERAHSMLHKCSQHATRSRSPLKKCYNHVLSRVPLLACGARICGSVLASCSGASQQENLLPDGSSSRRSSMRSIRSTSRPSAPAPFSHERITDAGQLGVHPCRTFCIMCISRNCTRQHTRQHCGTGRWSREPALWYYLERLALEIMPAAHSRSCKPDRVAARETTRHARVTL